MIDVDEKELIRRAHFLQGLSMRRIARERRHSRHTVRRALEDPGPPVYRRRQPKPRPVLGPYAAVIDQWLVEDQHLQIDNQITCSVGRLSTIILDPGTDRGTSEYMYRRLEGLVTDA